ncbi:hypothetical protein [Chamaesiphon sp. VAR_48_metabat_135_sub]|uniref:helix-turn-helix domain-containing transcriptional regulator n=1 Tax=Chamaesiphon sp. VAR_48_metabat_135_sub TaxID=2964699 RepID=UPI00286AB2C1|nr:hypothetical protein [Chamaesiphon sp. VAR_48_metabat_135_sub]
MKYIFHPAALIEYSEADQVGMTRQGLQKALSDEGNPRFGNITSIVQAMGYRLVPQKLPQSQPSL